MSVIQPAQDPTRDATDDATTAISEPNTCKAQPPAAGQPQPTAPSPETSKPLPARARLFALLLGALAVAVCIDRLVFTSEPRTIVLHIAIFWMVCLAASMALFLRSALHQPMWWFLAVALLTLLIRILTFPDSPGDANSDYQFLTLLLLAPALLMLQLQLGTGRFEPYHPSRNIIRWFGGWFVDPFSYLPRFIAALQAVTASKIDAEEQDTAPANRHLARKIAAAALIAAPVLAALVSLLYSSDLVFAYFVQRFIGDIDLTHAALHLLAIAIPFPFLFSLLANVNRRADAEPIVPAGQTAAALARQSIQQSAQRRETFDVIIVEFVFGAVLALYSAFSAVQFAFLFARQGLPNGYTYAQYAREGFFQLLLVACINLIGFGIVLLFCRRTKTVLGMQIALLAATAVLLASSATRLGLYINVYGLTWLRFVSMAFIALLAVILMLCLMRLFAARVPLLTVCFILLVVWYLVLGALNPSGFIAAYNSAHGL
ncbi:DUF4153 domain-containing protein [Bifidobacterium sp.]|jgi:hypothetical protein|uniref:DUF4153 domain-containing protein n=1 Tax=Bifidobacterium sp. TaxID=41200 RepID=UPI0025C38374|nr:DUF4173 domain-containing protein [Bifidobacterium sp.]MCH4209404.1 DUF4173 domain-containing protein [Bifidobacterium sp.]MCI1224983.1 DUF4173 domain-containing protein [Bifidobacterium sp.]